MKKLALLFVATLVAGALACGGSETKDDPAPTEESAQQEETKREIQPAASGGMERGFEDEAEAAADEAPAEAVEEGGGEDAPE